MDIFGKNPDIICPNDASEHEVSSRAVTRSNFYEFYAAILSPKGSQHLVSMTERLYAMRQLKIKSKDIVSDKINAAYESVAF